MNALISADAQLEFMPTPTTKSQSLSTCNITTSSALKKKQKNEAKCDQKNVSILR